MTPRAEADVGLTSARALFAKRRMGKSEFLEQDLIPAAREAGYTDRELLRLMASDFTDFFSESSRLRLGAALGLNKAVAKNVPQQSLRRLQDADLVLRMDYGDYRVQDDAFAEWVRSRELEE